ncbi:MAG: hypothetical protein ORO02_07730 [Bacteroidia bacterium]|jgi:hypothetical protein|nr:hypothetical protein [Bacteroidia bacterium]
MENEKFNKQPKLLSVKFKKIGIGVIVLSILPGLIIKSMHIVLMQSQRELFKSLSYSGFLMGLIIIVLSRDKEEDELTIYLRLTAMLDMFVFAVIYVIIKPLIVLMFQTTFIDITGQQLVTLMLIGYLISYYLKRYNR